MKPNPQPYVSTTNACKLCKPLGACLAFRGVEGAVPFLHGSQGCATYMRRYVISHFREPMDIASSSLGEKHAVYGGGPNLKLGLKNLVTKYNAGIIGVATTCLTETIGDDVRLLVHEFRNEYSHVLHAHQSPELVTVSTPSYGGTHAEGFHAAVRALVDQLAEDGPQHAGVNLLPGFLSPADIRHLREVASDFGIQATILPDISLTLDAPALRTYEKIPSGGTRVADIKRMGRARATVEFGRTLPRKLSTGALLAERWSVPHFSFGAAIGLRETDAFFHALEEITCRPSPEPHVLERGRLVDAYVDAHKYLFGKRAVVYGEEDLIVGLASFLAEIGVLPVICASGGRSGRLKEAVAAVTSNLVSEPPVVLEGVDFHEIERIARGLEPDLLIGNSKGYHLARTWKVPLVRVGFPIHDRFGAARVLHVGYRGAQALLDRIVNTLIEARQEASSIGYTYY